MHSKPEDQNNTKSEKLTQQRSGTGNLEDGGDTQPKPTRLTSWIKFKS